MYGPTLSVMSDADRVPEALDESRRRLISSFLRADRPRVTSERGRDTGQEAQARPAEARAAEARGEAKRRRVPATLGLGRQTSPSPVDASAPKGPPPPAPSLPEPDTRARTERSLRRPQETKRSEPRARRAPDRPTPAQQLSHPPRTHVAGSGEWWYEQLHGGELAPLSRVPPPPPPPASGAITGEAVAPAAPPPVVRRPAWAPPGWRPNLVAAVVAVVVLLLCAALVAIPGRLASNETPATSEVAPPPAEPEPSPSVSVVAPEPSPDRTTGGAEEEPSSSPPPGSQDSGGAGTSEISLAEQLTQRINEIREARGRQSLFTDPDLQTVAVRHVGEMIEEGRLVHTPNSVLARRVTNWKVLAESIGVGPDLEAIERAFLNSEVDRRNMLDPQFWHIGVGAVRSARRVWVTILFNDRSDPETSLPR